MTSGTPPEMLLATEERKGKGDTALLPTHVSPRPSILSRCSALTLIEIIVVMAIMTILVSTLVVAGFSVQRRAQVRGTKGLLQKIAQALNQYRITYRVYVPQDNLIDEANPVQARRYSLPLWQASEHEGQFLSVNAKHKAAGGPLTDPSTSSQATWYYYQDAWRKPLKYICGPPYNSFTITSSGPDLEWNTGDDIVEE